MSILITAIGHGAKFVQDKGAAVQAYPGLAKNGRTANPPPDQYRHDKHHWRTDQQGKKHKKKIKASFDTVRIHKLTFLKKIFSLRSLEDIS
jgi:hypothetical protein